MKKVDIYFHNDFYDIVANDLESYDYDLLFEIAFYSLAHRKKILDYLFKVALSRSYDDVLAFKTELVDCGLYRDYKKSILNSNDNFFKSSLVLYFENDLKDKLYANNLELAKTIVDSNADYILKLSNLVNISQFVCDDDTIKYIKKQMNDILREHNKDENEEYLNQILESNYKLIDNNQSILKDEKRLNYKG